MRPYNKVPLRRQPTNRDGDPVCANLGCGLTLEQPIHYVELVPPKGETVVRCFCVDCYTALMKEGHASFY